MPGTGGKGISVAFPPRTPSSTPPAAGGTTSTSNSDVKDSVPPRASSQFIKVTGRTEREKEMAETTTLRPKEMAVSSFPCHPRAFNPYSSFECRSHTNFSGAPLGDKPRVGLTPRVTASSFCTGGGIGEGLSSLIFRLKLNVVRQLSTKAHHNCNNIAVAQVVADDVAVLKGCNIDNGSVQIQGSDDSTTSFMSRDGSISDDSGEGLGHGIISDAITTPVANTTVVIPLFQLMEFFHHPYL